ncbi:hypothetical protein EDB92DRAFT_1288317 [Lactarius akahatsu]|uniref:F-box domain-containing protein n=1 Tax=Lactarius akahatsu TaxID=416441 RepID=A0AAD4LC02_9AGAM|nr:hypothetical protein EDB92DRAFT_1288317 [Lactarius akahatsu]
MLVSSGSPPAGLTKISMSTNSSGTLTGLPTELLIRIFAHLQVEDLLSVQHTCRRFCDVISGSASLQYFLRTEINLLENILPSDFSLRDHVALLKHHETAWNNLQLNKFTRFLTCEESHARCYILQDGYLIYKAVTNTAQYGYLDLYSSSAQPNAELLWAHISLATGRPLSDMVFAVDHNLVVAIRSGQNGHATKASFLEFTTGSCHPLALVHTVSLPVHPVFDCRKPEVEVLGDYILVIAVHEVLGHSTFSVISWKTGRVTQLYHMLGDLRVVVIDPDNSLIALIKCATNSIELCKLQFIFGQPCLHSLCFLRLPIFKYTNPISVFTNGIEWIPTSKPQDRTRTSRERSFPFRPYRAGTIGLTLSYRTGDGARQYSMFVSIGALLSVAHSGVRHVPWADWGPAGTRILPLGNGILPRPAGPFWITNYAPLVVRDYDTLRARYIKKKKKKKKMTIPTTGEPSLGPPSTTLFGKHWREGEVKTHLPFRKFVAGGPSFKRVVQVVADREWVVVISRTRSRKRTSITVYYVG